MARRIRTNLNSVNRAVQRNALKAAINNSLRVYMTSQSNANLRAVNNATKALIKTYIEEHEEKQAPSGNGGNGNKPRANNGKPLALTNGNKPHTNNGNGNGGNQSRAIVPVGNVTPLGPNMKAPLANRGANEKNRQPTAMNLNRLRGIAKGASNNNTILKNQTNFVNALTRNYPNNSNVKAAKNAVNARRAAKSITASAITEARVQAAEAASNAAKAAAAASGRNKLRVAMTAARGASLLKLAGNAGATRRNALNAQIAAANAMNAAYTKYMNKISGANTMNSLGAINRNIVASANLNDLRKSNLRKEISNQQKKIAIQQKKNAGQGVRAERALTRATRSNNALASANLNRGNLMNRYSKYRGEINAATSKKELNRLVTVLGGKTGKLFSENEKTNARAAINRKSNSLKGPGPSPNVPPPMTNGPKNNTMSKLNLSALNAIIRTTKARLNKGDSKNKTKNERILANATWRANQLRSKKKGLFGHIGGALGAVGGAAKYVAAGTVHHAKKGAKVIVPVALAGAAYLGQQGARRGFNVTIGGKKPSKKIPNTSLNNGNKKPGKLERAVQKNENMAATRKAYQQSVGGNASENAMSAAGAFGALAVAAGAAGAARGAAALKRASNLGRAAKTGMYSAKTLRYAAK